MNRWFRVYDTLVDDPKVQRLPDSLFRALINLWCLASQGDGLLPAVGDIAFKLRIKPVQAQKLLSDLRNAGLIVDDETGTHPHNWSGRQFVSDGSSDRVQRYRDKRKASGLPTLGDYTKFKPALIERDGERCIYCETTGRMVVDHMIPIALGGTDHEDNLALACKPCNSGKSGRTPELANMTIRVTSAAIALRRYRDSHAVVTVTETPPEAEQIQNRAEAEQTRASVSNSEKVLRTDLMEAFGPSRTPDLSRAGIWLSKGYSHTMILEVVKELLARKPDISSLNYFDAALAERHINRPESPSEKIEAAAKIDMDSVVAMFIKTGIWSKYAGNEPGMGGCRCPPEILIKHGINPKTGMRMQ